MSWRTSPTLNCSVFPKPCSGDSPSNATFLPHNSRTIRPASVISGAWFADWLAPGARAAPVQTQERATKATTAGILTRTIRNTISGTDSSRVRKEPRLPEKTPSGSRDFVRIVGKPEVGEHHQSRDRSPQVGQCPAGMRPSGVCVLKRSEEHTSELQSLRHLV